MQVIIKENEEDLINELGKLIVQLSSEAINKNGSFKIGVSGGSLVKFLCHALQQQQLQINFTKWKVFFCDERVVSVDDPDSTFGLYKKELISKLDGLDEEQFVQIKQGVNAEIAAKDYIQQMQSHFPSNSLPRFDLLLLGMGPDGHTCSLFPGHVLLKEDGVWVAPITDSAKPPPSRITLTFPVINNAAAIAFAVAGEGKADMIKRILVEKEDLPVSRVKPCNGELFWILDKAAGKYVN